MKIYLGHSTAFDYKKELYLVFLNSELTKQHEIILPHKNSNDPYNSKELLPTCDLMIAEVSYPSTGLGIELGWASYNQIPILCIHKTDSKVSRSLKTISSNFLEYSSSDELISKLKEKINSMK
ncbi:hypothetical protein HOA92_00395 [archaeon]|jgi:hypothetical protein|nr:hypothetical protein [archaeon]MBT6761477.1 hypothetical protein [archaeon]